MRRPLIGVTTYGRDEQNQFPLPAEYVDAVRRAGAIPVLLPPGERDTGRVLETINGLVLAGGGDIDPAVYGGARHEAIYMVDAERDRFEIDLVRRAVRTGLPTLGICRGMQMINVALGGTLHAHLPDVVGQKVSHRLPPREPTPHEILLDPQSRLARILGQARFSAASWHHQAVRELAAPLQAVGAAPDGVVEAVQLGGHPWLCAVQWHPELTAADEPLQQRLFDALVQAILDQTRTEGR